MRRRSQPAPRCPPPRRVITSALTKLGYFSAMGRNAASIKKFVDRWRANGTRYPAAGRPPAGAASSNFPELGPRTLPETRHGPLTTGHCFRVGTRSQLTFSDSPAPRPVWRAIKTEIGVVSPDLSRSLSFLVFSRFQFRNFLSCGPLPLDPHIRVETQPVVDFLRHASKGTRFCEQHESGRKIGGGNSYGRPRVLSNSTDAHCRSFRVLSLVKMFSMS